MIKPITLPPFKKMCITIGNLPSSFMESMSYYEALCWLVNYLQEQVIPAVNTNSEAVTELQNAFTTLKNYVDNYFDNLDVQEEINTKLDDMADDGTLAEIINQEIFGDIQTRLEAVEGDITDINSDIDDIEEQLNQTDKIVMFGDSYARGSLGGGQTTTSWCTRVARLMNKESDYYADGVSGGAFYNGTLNTGFNTFVGTIPAADKPKVSKVIIGAGANDFVIPSATTNISTNIASMISVIKTNFPNAKIYFCFIGYKNILQDVFATVRANLLNSVIANYQSSQNYGALFAGNIGYILHASNLISADDGTHPTELGYVYISEAIYNFVECGKSFIRPFSSGVTVTPLNENITINQSNQVYMCDEITTWNSPEFQITFADAVNTNNVGVLQIGTFDNPSFIRPNSSTTLIASGTALVTFNDNSQQNLEINLRIGYTGEAYLVFNKQYTNIKNIRSRSLQGALPTVAM